MASRHHPPDGFARGETFIVNGSLFGADGLPLDLPGTVLTWALRPERGGGRGIELPTDADAGSIEILDEATAEIRVTLNATATAALAPGRYVDELRVTVGEVVSQLWHGSIAVDDSPFEVAA